MILIAHRGNISGPSKKENSPKHIKKALDLGFHAEIDVWKLEDGFYLGHDSPVYPIDLNFLVSRNLWCHAKNLEALELMIRCGIRCFWHEEDDYTLTSTGEIWTYPLKDVVKNSIIVCKDLEQTKTYAEKDICGVCSDYVGEINQI